MKLWVDDVRPAPHSEYIWLRSVDACIAKICLCETLAQNPDTFDAQIDLIDLDHDAGSYYPYGGDYIRILDWLEETGRNYPIRIHSMNPVGRRNMLAIIQKNGWKLVY